MCACVCILWNENCTGVGDNGGLQLAMALSDNRTLDTLHLASNPVGEETMSTLVQVLTSDNETLQRLDLRGTAMSKAAQRKVSNGSGP